MIFVMNEQQPSPNQPKQNQNAFQMEPLSNHQPTYRSFWQLFFVIFVVSLSSFYFGYTIIYINTIDFDTVITIYNITIDKSTALGVVVFCVPLGGLIGAWLSSYFINNHTRRNSILLVNLFAFVVGLLIFPSNYNVFLFLRICQGICAGINSALVPLIIKQIVPSQLSGMFGAFHQIFICGGIVVACLLSYFLGLAYNDPMGHQYWKVIFGFSLIPLSIQSLILLIFLRYQTPQQLAKHGQFEKTKIVVKLIYKQQFVDSIYKKIIQKYDINSTSKHQERPQLNITKKIALHLALLQQFVGISAVASYGKQIAEGSLSNFKASLLSILNIQQLLTAILSSFLLTKFGRKSILQFGTMGAAISNLIIFIGFLVIKSHPDLSVGLILIALFYYMANFGLSLGPIVWMYIPEIVTPKFIPYSTLLNWGGSALCLLLFPIIKERLPDKNPAMLFLFFSIWSFTSFAYNRRYIIETKDKSQDQIYFEYQRLQNV